MPDYSKRVVVEPKASWQRPVISRVEELPESPMKGDRYILTTDKKIYMWSGEQWLADIPSEGWFTWVLTEDKLYEFDGTDWVEFPVHTHPNKEILDLIEVALTEEMKNHWDEAYNLRHDHQNKEILDQIEVALTNALKDQYDEAYNKRAQYDDELGVVFFEGL